jgi:hypothetical protein
MLELEAPGCKGKGKRQAIICFGHYKTLEQGSIDEHGGGREWGGPRRRWRWCGVEAHAAKERACSVNPASVREAFSDSPTRTRWRSGRRSARTRRLWRHGGS